MADFKPVRFGKYLILDKIATGGMAELYQAKITSVEGFEKLVAIKKILPNLTQDKNLVNMFIDEAKLAAMLTHQNIVQIYDLGSMEGTYFIAMEYIYGKDLRVLTRKAEAVNLPLPIEYGLYITCRICSGLDYSHNLQDLHGNPLELIHRDISPQNILVTYQGEVKIVDFGIAKAAKKTADTKEGLIKGKVSYMSPEQAAGKPIDKRSDIFSTGILLYEMVTGERMFEGSDLQILERVRKAEFEPAENIVPDLPSEVSRILNRALAKGVTRRYKSCGEMLADLEACLSAFPVRPSAEGLSQYMKALFAEEIAAEAAALQRAEVHLSSLRGEPVSEAKTKTLQILDHIEPVPTKKKEVAQGTHKIWLGTWAAVMVVAAIVLALIIKQKPTSTPSHNKPLAPVKAEKVLPSTKTKSTVAVKPTRRDQAMEALDKKRFAKAAALFEEILAAEPDKKQAIASPYAQALVGGAISIVSTKPKQAETLLTKAVDLDPENVEAHFYLGKLYTSKKEYPKAIGAYDKAIGLDPHFTDGFFNLGFLYYATKDYVKAEQMFARVVELHPSYLDEAYFNLAVVQNLQGNKVESIRNLEKALEVNPANKRAKKYLLRIKRTSQNGGKTTNLSENQNSITAGPGIHRDTFGLRNSGQICTANKRKTSLLG
jgi:serine/threonine protein kinase